MQGPELNIGAELNSFEKKRTAAAKGIGTEGPNCNYRKFHFL